MRPDPVTELTAFMTLYERAHNSHEIDRVVPMIDDNATYWLSEGVYQGLDKIAYAIERTFATIRGEAYEISNLEWVVLAAHHAVCRYHFLWKGVVDGQPSSRRGRGTNVMVKRRGAWKILYEHLSA